ncbi:MAG: signal peptidase I [Candidatus Levybacteria bacterium]|nr:signal peptidase I [Candidatus Levybacteria bacterium]
MKNKLKKISNHKVAKHTKTVLKWKFSVISFIFLPLAIFTLLTAKTTIIPTIQSFVVLTGSMKPTLPIGAVVYTQKGSAIQKGDVITFSNNKGQIITHRVVDIKKATSGLSYQTKGDANNTTDQSLVPSTSIKGKVLFSLPYLGYLINALRSPVGFLMFVILPILIFIALELWNIKGEIEKSIERKLRQELSIKKYEKIDIS